MENTPTTTTTTTNKWQARIEQRRQDPNKSVVGYVEALIKDRRMQFEELAPFLNAEELQVFRDRAAERAREQAEAKARAEAERLQQQEESRKLGERIMGFRSEHPLPVPWLDRAEDMRDLCCSDEADEHDEKAVFDILHRHHITRVVWETQVGYFRYDHEDHVELHNSELKSIMLGDDIELDDVGDAIIPDDDPEDDGTTFKWGHITDALTEAINKIAEGRVSEVANDYKIDSENDLVVVTFDVPKRTISVKADIETTASHSLKFKVK
jgi:hypothetical protein